MKISIESAAANYINAAQAEIKNKRSVPIQDAGGNFDQIMIQANSREIAETKVAEAAKKQAASAIYQKTPEGKLSHLKEQIDQGRYEVDAEVVASKILFMKGEE